jgi:hypothetical protein
VLYSVRLWNTVARETISVPLYGRSMDALSSISFLIYSSFLIGQYYEAVYLMKHYLHRLPVTGTFNEEAIRKLLQQKIGHYEKRASALMNDDSSSFNNPRSPVGYQKTSFSQEDDLGDESRPNSRLHGPVYATETPRSTDSDLINSRASQANTKLSHALDLDEAGNTAAATTVYVEAAELYLQTLQAVRQCETSSSQIQSVKSHLIRRLELTLDRIEEIRSPTSPRSGSSIDDGSLASCTRVSTVSK